MPIISAILSVEVHRKLKGEAVNKGIYLRHLVAQILEEHAKNNKADKPQRQPRNNLSGSPETT